MAYLDNTGLAYFWGKIKAWANSAFALLGHTHPASDVTLMTGYSKPASSSAISASDSLNQAVGKLERGAETADGNALHRTGDEEASGVKAMKGLLSGEADVTTVFGVRHSGLTKGTVPAEANMADLLFLDDSANVGLDWAGRLGSVEHVVSDSGATSMHMHCFKNDASIFRHNRNDFVNPVTALSVGFDSDGIPYAAAPATSSLRSNPTDIVTRGWIPLDSRIVHTSGNEEINGIKTFNNIPVFKTQATIENSLYKTFLRNDDVNFYILLSDSGSSSFNSLRPFRVDLASGDVYLEGGNRAAFWRAQGVNIYISKNGDDSNTGLTSSSPVLTVNKAVEIASRYSGFGNVNFFFGPGEWGDVTLFGNASSFSRIVISNFTNNSVSTISDYNALTGSSEPPHFTSISLYNCYFVPQSIKVDILSIYSSTVYMVFTISFGQLVVKNCYCSIVSPYIVHQPSATVPSVFSVIGSYFGHGAFASVFSGTVSRTAFVICNSGASVEIASDASWSGTFSGYKFYCYDLANIPEFAKSPEYFPGTGFGSYSAINNSNFRMRSSAPKFTLTNYLASKDSAPASDRYWQIYASCGDTFTGNITNSVAYIQAIQDTSGTVSNGLYAVQQGSATNFCFGRAVYKATGENYFHVSSKLLLDGSHTITSPSGAGNSLNIFSDDSTVRGACIILYPNNASTASNSGNFRIRAAKDNAYKDIVGTPTGYLYWNGREYCGDGSDTQFARFNGAGVHYNGASLLVTGRSMDGYAGRFDLNAVNSTTTTSLRGNPGGTLTWNGQTIQTTSDERKKDFISSVPDEVLDAWESVEWVRFKYKADIAEKGADNCRWHSGIVAQRVEKACAGAGVDILSYGMLCHDQSLLDVGSDEREDLWMARYEEALCMEAAYQRRENARLKKRVADLEERLSALELRLGSE